VVPRIAVTCPGSQGTSCPCSPFMTREEVPGSSLVLCLGPGPSSLLHLPRANAEKPYAGDTSPFITVQGQGACVETDNAIFSDRWAFDFSIYRVQKSSLLGHGVRVHT